MMETPVYKAVYEFEDDHWWFAGRRAIIERLIARFLGAHSDLQVLDVGCGTGGTTQSLTRYGPVTGIDLMAEGLAFAQRRGLPRLVQSRAERLPFLDDSFDLVCALDVLEHLQDDRAGLAELKRVCRHQGMILLYVPAFPILWSAEDVVSHHWRRYTWRTLRACVGIAGLSVRAVSYVNMALFLPVFAFARMYAWLDRNREPRTNLRPVAALPNRLLTRYLALEASLATSVPLPFGTSLVCLLEKE
jgi:ubiquinone/menaquinone biosynthesis C-methylase UbiE